MSKWTDHIVVAAIVVVLLFFAARYPAYARTGGDLNYSEFAAANYAAGAKYNQPEISIAYSDFLARVENNEVRSVTIRDHSITGDATDGKKFVTYTPNDPSLIERLTAHGITVNVVPNGDGLSRSLVTDWLLALLLVGVAIYLMSQTQSGGGQQIGIGRSRARLVVEPGRRLTFADVAGIDEARQELGEVVEFLQHPEKFVTLGGRIPKGCLLVGPPGTGKTLLARAIAGEANVPFYSVAGSDFVEMYVGVGASRVRDMFAEAKRHPSCIIFIDEIDAVGRRRGAGLGGNNDEREQTLNQLLVEMDGFEGNHGVIVIAATNRPDVLDPALLRPGRFDRQVVVPNPDVAGREQILAIHLRKVPTAADVDAQQIARGTPGFSGADLANMVNEAALLAARKGGHLVSKNELEGAKERILMGPERRSLAMTAEDRNRMAYHEAGHALVALHMPGNDPLHKVTIVPRGKALGITLVLPEHDRHGFAKQEMDARIAMMLGGRVAEKLIYGTNGVTTGAADDIRQATGLARRMVTELGFSDRLGPLHYSEEEEGAFHGHSITRHKSISDATVGVIDEEIRRIVGQGEAAARALLIAHVNELHRVASALIERETLSRDEIDALLGNGCVDSHGREAGAEPCLITLASS